MSRFVFLLAPLFVVVTALAQDEPSEKKKPGLTIIDNKNKEHSISSWKFSEGTRPLTWLAPPPKEPAKPDPEKCGGAPRGRAVPVDLGPEALSIREDDSTTFVKGVLTLVPLENIKSIEFDNEEQKITVRVAGSDEGSDTELTGSTKFRGINKVTIQAEVDRGERGVAELTFQGGVPDGIKALKFAAPKPTTAPKGKTAKVTINDGKKTVAEVIDLKPLYLLPSGREIPHDLLMFKKTFKVKMSELTKLVNTSNDAVEAVCQIALTDGTDEKLTLLPTIEIDGKKGTFQGFLGRTSAGYRVFPIHTVVEINIGE